MIVYAGKQFWNDFNNGDEALFEDAGLPRDSNKFKIQAWVQAQKLNWKKQNTNTDATQFHVYWFSLQQWYAPSSSASSLYWWTATWRMKFKAKYTESDLSELNGYVDAFWHTRTAKEAQTLIQDAYSQWDAKANVVDTALEVLETGTYIIDCFAQFVYPQGYSYSTWTSYPLFLDLLKYKENVWFQTYAYTQGRSCAYLDELRLQFCEKITKGTRLWMLVCHWYTYKKIMVAGRITAVRIN